MWVDSAANVDNDRHRILVLAERGTWHLAFPLIAMYADTVGANGQGLRVAVDARNTDPLPVDVEDPPGSGVIKQVAPAYYNGTTAKGVNLLDGIGGNPGNPGTFEDWISTGLMGAVKGIAQANGTYFTDAAAAQDFLSNGDTAGAIMYVEETTAVSWPATCRSALWPDRPCSSSTRRPAATTRWTSAGPRTSSASSW